MEKKNYWPQIESEAVITNSVTAKHVVEGERIIKAMIAGFDHKKENHNVEQEQYISNEASS